jgi:hypothetical protein
VVEVGDHHQGGHPAGFRLRGGDDHRRPRRADAVRLHRGHRRPAGPRLAVLSALAPAGAHRGHDHRLRLL